MIRNIVLIVTVASSIFLVVLAVKRFSIAKAGPKMPTTVLSIAALRYNAYTYKLEGAPCTLKGTCTSKNTTKENFTIYLADKLRDSFGKSVKCILSTETIPVFETITKEAELVVTGLVRFSGMEVFLTNVKVISMQESSQITTK